MVKYHTAEDILLIHSMVIDEAGGAHGIRDRNAILSLIESPKQSFFGNELYPTLFEKAAVYAHDIMMNHPFVDGNERTGIAAASIFLEDNGHEITVKEGEIKSFILRIIPEKLAIPQIAEWFKAHSKKQ